EKQLLEYFIIDKQLLFLLRLGHGGLPRGQQIGSVKLAPGFLRYIMPLKSLRRFAQRGHEFLTRGDVTPRDAAFARRAGYFIPAGTWCFGLSRRAHDGSLRCRFVTTPSLPW